MQAGASAEVQAEPFVEASAEASIEPSAEQQTEASEKEALAERDARCDSRQGGRTLAWRMGSDPEQRTEWMARELEVQW